jgi:hypothetical protein
LVTVTPGAYVVISSTAAGSTALKVTIPAADFVILRGLTITGHGTAANGIWFTGAGTLQIENCAVSGFAQHGIFQSASGKMHVKDTEVRDGRQYGIRMYVNSGSITGSIDHCRVQNIGLAVYGTGHGVLIGNNASVTVSNTVSAGNHYGFSVGGSGRMVVSDSTAEGNGDMGFYVWEGGHMAATHCRAAANTNNGFYAVTAGVMTIDGSVSANNGSHGVWMSGSGTVARVANTTAVDNDGYGFVNGGATFISRGNNTVYGNKAGQTLGTITYDTAAQ